MEYLCFGRKKKYCKYTGRINYHLTNTTHGFESSGVELTAELQMKPAEK